MEGAQLFDILDRGLELLERLDEETARAAGRVEDRLAELRRHLLHDEADRGPRSVELARVAGGVAHLAQHRLVQVRHRVDVVGGGEVDPLDLVDDVAQEVAGEHAAVGLLEDGGDRVARVELPRP